MNATPLPIEVFLPDCGDVDSATRESVRHSSEVNLHRLAAELGLDLAPAVRLNFGNNGERAMPDVSGVPEISGCTPWFLVNGSAVIPPPGVILRGLSALPRSEHRDALLRAALVEGSPAVGEEVLSASANSLPLDQREVLLELLAVDLLVATFRRRPGLFATPDCAQHWWARNDPDGMWSTSWRSDRLLRGLLEAGLTAAIDETSASALEAASAACAGTDEAVQWVVSHSHAVPFVFLELSPVTLGMVVRHPVSPGESVPVAESGAETPLADMWSIYASWVTEKTGVLMPKLYLRAVQDCEDNTARLRIQARLLEPVRIPGWNESWAQDTRGPGSPFFVTSSFNGVFVDKAEDPTASTDKFLAEFVARELYPVVHLLLDAEQVAYRLAQVEDVEPRLVDHVMERVGGLAELTLILRQLLAEGVSLGDMSGTLEAVASAALIKVGERHAVALDPRPSETQYAEKELRWLRYLPAIRRNLCSRLPLSESSRILSMPWDYEDAIMSSGVGASKSDARMGSFVREAQLKGASIVAGETRPRLAEAARGSDPPVRAFTPEELALRGRWEQHN